MTCPRCSVADISPATGACTLCGFVPEGDGSSVAVAIPHPDATDQLARLQLAHLFRIDVLLGHGRHSSVYLARELDATQMLVLKVLPRPQDRDPQADERFRRVCEQVQGLDHPHIVSVRRFGTTDSLFWYTMDHVRSRSLREILRARGPLELKTCQRLVAQIASALDYAHRRGIVHGDLKPENVLIDPNGWVHVCDAMIRRALETPIAVVGRPNLAGPPRPNAPGARAARLTKSGPDRTGKGGPARPPAPPPRKTPEGMPSASAERRPDYTAPEDYQSGQRTAFADQYALAALVHECLAGTTPSAGAAAYEPVTPLATIRPDLPAHLVHAVRRALSPKPGDRYPGILDFATALESGALALTDSHPSGRGSDIVLTVPGWTPPPKDRPRWLVPGIAALLLAIAAWYVVPRVRTWQQMRSVAADTRRPAPPAAAAAPAARPTAESTGAAARDTPTIAARDTQQRPVASRDRGRGRTTSPTRNREPSGGRSAPVTSSRTPSRSSLASAVEPGHLFVNASPWGQLFIDGQPVGNTPKANLAVTPGAHTIRVVREGFQTVERQVQVGAGETVRVTDIVLAPRP